jgi:hypothetical protein
MLIHVLRYGRFNFHSKRQRMQATRNARFDEIAVRDLDSGMRWDWGMRWVFVTFVRRRK